MDKTSIIERPLYTELIERWLGKGLIVVLTGQRRVGKSYTLLFLKGKLESNPENNVIFIDKEKREFDSIETYKELDDFIANRYDATKQNYILIDEVQNIDGFEKALRSWRTEPNTDIIVTGSNAKMLSSELSTLIGGRYTEIYILPLGYNEFLTFHNLSDNEDSLRLYLNFGGLPGLTKFELTEGDARQYQLDVYHTALLKDVIARNEIRNVPFLESLTKFIADNIGKPISPANIAKYMKSQGEKVTTGVISNYLKYLTEAYIMHYVPRYDIHGKAILDSNGKYYFEDVGIRNALVGGSRQQDIEKIIENVIYQELRRQGHNVQIGHLRAGEVDFVTTRPNDNGPIYIQASYLIGSDETYQREFGTLARIKDNYPKYVISMSPLVNRLDDNGIAHLSLHRFLTKGLE